MITRGVGRIETRYKLFVFLRCNALNPNRSLDRYSVDPYEEDNFLSSFIFLLASCFSFVLDVARYAFELTTNHLLNNQIKSVQELNNRLGLILFSTFITSLSFWVEIFRMNCYLLNAAKGLYRNYMMISLWENRFFILEVIFFTALLISCVEIVCKNISF